MPRPRTLNPYRILSSIYHPDRYQDASEAIQNRAAKQMAQLNAAGRVLRAAPQPAGGPTGSPRLGPASQPAGGPTGSPRLGPASQPAGGPGVHGLGQPPSPPGERLEA